MRAISQSPAAQQGSANITRSLPVIQTKGVPAGTAAFEKTRQTIIDDFNAKVPDHLRIDGKYITHLPLDVTNIPRSCGILSQEELAITEDYDAVGLAAAVAERKYTAVAVATAFSKRAIIRHQITHCLT
ncbi:hypothetical protein AUEXF2481DRAFT_31518 [Aureobasidium subglaciale EXF-2481]|uniref:Uncharacterized protein n=1 Tax=Aureobasidium subglaciale (strain EXF-2481) TaxID=1043005 RepID=A0A074YG64_AURSE|nr:uncharacterized protein AUEXF2481DRAFT_31518 [Aureobasidium subglaciale EXF-2481]KEQ93062.1 hypothetical protein AUEXF2481DRAFT_31518 [Aureobasidium subglaciale EXF-2481]